jgi:hypothetical protein
MSTIVSILKETEEIVPTGSKRAVEETLRQFLRRERLEQERVRAGRPDPHTSLPNSGADPIALACSVDERGGARNRLESSDPVPLRRAPHGVLADGVLATVVVGGFVDRARIEVQSWHSCADVMWVSALRFDGYGLRRGARRLDSGDEKT